MYEIQNIVREWLDDQFGSRDAEWIEAGAEDGEFESFMDDLAESLSGDVESDLQTMVEDNLQNFHLYSVESEVENAYEEVVANNEVEEEEEVVESEV